jgi:hypothetical protein
LNFARHVQQMFTTGVMQPVTSIARVAFYDPMTVNAVAPKGAYTGMIDKWVGEHIHTSQSRWAQQTRRIFDPTSYAAPIIGAGRILKAQSQLATARMLQQDSLLRKALEPIYGANGVDNIAKAWQDGFEASTWGSFMQTGAGGASRLSAEIVNDASEALAQIAPEFYKRFGGNPINQIRARGVVRAYTNVLEAFQNGTKLQVYALNDKMTPKARAHLVRTVMGDVRQYGGVRGTTFGNNFQKFGLNAIGYLRPTLSGIHAHLKAARKDPAMWLSGVGAGALGLTGAMWSQMIDDEENRKLVSSMTPNQRGSAIYLMNNGEILGRLPIPQELQFFYAPFMESVFSAFGVYSPTEFNQANSDFLTNYFDVAKNALPGTQMPLVNAGFGVLAGKPMPTIGLNQYTGFDVPMQQDPSVSPWAAAGEIVIKSLFGATAAGILDANAVLDPETTHSTWEQIIRASNASTANNAEPNAFSPLFSVDVDPKISSFTPIAQENKAALKGIDKIADNGKPGFHIANAINAG